MSQSVQKRFVFFAAVTVLLMISITSFWSYNGSLDITAWRDSYSTQQSNTDAQCICPSPDTIYNASIPDALLDATMSHDSPESDAYYDSQAPEIEDTSTGPDTVVLYAYFEESSGNALRNAKFFIDHALHDSIDFIFILQGESPKFNKLKLDKPNVRIIQRENTCMDLGSYGEVLRAEPSLTTERYKKFIFINASVRGPFFPSHSRTCWSQAFTNPLDEMTKLVSISGHCLNGLSQTQSMLFATDNMGVAAMLENGSLNCTDSHEDAINNEVHMASRLMENNNWQSWTLLTATQADRKYEAPCVGDIDTIDPWLKNTYFGFNVHPYETIFVKANRDIDQHMLEKYTEWHDRMAYSSYDYC